MKITLCGSTRFHERYKEINAALSKLGHVVYSVALAEKAGDVITAEEKVILDLVHLLKIQESDAIVVIGRQEDGTVYIGDSTRREIMWAHLLDKHIFCEESWSWHFGRMTKVEEPGVLGATLQDTLDRVRRGGEKPEAKLVQEGGTA